MTALTHELSAQAERVMRARLEIAHAAIEVLSELSGVLGDHDMVRSEVVLRAIRERGLATAVREWKAEVEELEALAARETAGAA